MSFVNIISSHSEPLFGIKSSSITPDMLEDWLFILAAENYKKMQFNDFSKIPCGQFKHGVVAELFFRLCHWLKQPYEVKYHAIELFDHFMTKHLDDLHHYIQSNFTEEHRDCEWQQVLARVKKQVVLRMFSCIQISSKLYCPTKSLSVVEIVVLLQKYGHPFQRKSVLKSELRVLNVVDYRVNLTTPVMYIGVLLEILGHNDRRVNVRPLHQVSLDVLDVFYLQHSDIYHKLFTRITGKTNANSGDLQKLTPVKSDSLFMATSIIACSAHIIQQYTILEMCEQMQFITRIPKEEIMELAIVLIGEILQPEETKV